MNSRVLSGWVVVLLAIVARDALGQQYTITDLGTLSGDPLGSSAYGLNNAGQVVGSCDYGSYGRAFLYSGGTMQDLGTLGGAGAGASSINDSGQVVGEAVTGTGGIAAFLYSGGTMQDLNNLIAPGSDWRLQSAAGINNVVQIVGTAYPSGSGAYAFIYSGGSLTKLGTLG